MAFVSYSKKMVVAPGTNLIKSLDNTVPVKGGTRA